MTFSIIARCPDTGRLGLGITTFSIAAGGRCEGIRFGAGVCKTQAYVKRDNDLIALELLEQGMAPAGVMAALEADDPDHDWRQIAIIDREGRTCAHTGPGCRPWAGHHEGDGFVALGNVLAGREVLDGIVAGFLADPGAELEFRLLAALEGGRDAGARSATRGTSPKGRPRSSWPPSPITSTSTCASTCMTTPSPSCAACWRSSRSTRSSIATVVFAPTWR